MTSILVIIQFVLVVFICICVLLQKSSSIGLGSYSGSNESLFGAKGPAGFLAKFTFIVGLLFLVNTIALGYLYNKPVSIVQELKSIPKADLVPSVPTKSLDENLPVVPKTPVAPDAGTTKPAAKPAAKPTGAKPAKPAAKPTGAKPAKDVKPAKDESKKASTTSANNSK